VPESGPAGTFGSSPPPHALRSSLPLVWPSAPSPSPAPMKNKGRSRRIRASQARAKDISAKPGKLSTAWSPPRRTTGTGTRGGAGQGRTPPRYPPILSGIHRICGRRSRSAGRSRFTTSKTGKIHEQIGNRELAIAEYQKALATFEHLGQTRLGRPRLPCRTGLCHNDMGLLYGTAGKVTEARTALNTALKLQQELLDRTPRDAKALTTRR